MCSRSPEPVVNNRDHDEIVTKVTFNFRFTRKQGAEKLLRRMMQSRVNCYSLAFQRLRVANLVWTLLCVYNQLIDSNCLAGGLLIGGI